jgi:hypothetical protein
MKIWQLLLILTPLWVIVFKLHDIVFKLHDIYEQFKNKKI